MLTLKVAEDRPQVVIAETGEVLTGVHACRLVRQPDGSDLLTIKVSTSWKALKEPRLGFEYGGAPETARFFLVPGGESIDFVHFEFEIDVQKSKAFWLVVTIRLPPRAPEQRQPAS